MFYNNSMSTLWSSCFQLDFLYNQIPDMITYLHSVQKIRWHGIVHCSASLHFGFAVAAGCRKMMLLSSFVMTCASSSHHSSCTHACLLWSHECLYNRQRPVPACCDHMNVFTLGREPCLLDVITWRTSTTNREPGLLDVITWRNSTTSREPCLRPNF
jgi:hypothetical protein